MGEYTHYLNNMCLAYHDVAVFEELPYSPKISVIIPCYNAEKYLNKCFDSLIKQTFKNFEVICIDDGSTDCTSQIINGFSYIDKRFKSVKQKNAGPSKARNEGLKIARGEYIAFIDSDDWVDENYLEKLLDAIERNNCDIAAATIIRKRKFSQKYRVHYTEEKVYSSLEDKINVSRIPACCYIWNKLYKHEKIKDFKFKEGVFFEDVLWIPEVLKNTDKLVIVPDTNYYYRVNNSSIVKKLPSKKKQEDAYNSKKYIIKFFDANELNLSRKSRILTKHTKYLFKIPIFKIKEYNGKESGLLFGFIPISALFVKVLREIGILSKKIFSINRIDGHRLIFIFGIKIRSKYKYPLPQISISEYGLNKIERKTRVIASLTTFPERINEVKNTIITLLNQTVKPDSLLLWLANEQFPYKEDDLPSDLLKLKEYGLTIKWCNDIKSYKKLIPSLKEFPNDIIITFDDDVYYDNDIIEKLYNSYLIYPNCIHTNRSVRLKIDKNNLKVINTARLYWEKYEDCSFKNTIIGMGGVLYPPHSLNVDVLNENKFMSIVPTQDDFWFWAMAVLNGTKIKNVIGYDRDFLSVENTQQYGLAKINKRGKAGLCAEEGFNILAKVYPEILQNIKDECKTDSKQEKGMDSLKVSSIYKNKFTEITEESKEEVC